jgi:hypothetical protein
VLKGLVGGLTIKQLCFFAIEKERNLKTKNRNLKKFK